MNVDQVKNQIDKLITCLNKWNYEYHTLDNPSITDSEYDYFYHLLKKLETNFPDLIRKDSPTQKVGSKGLGEFKCG